MKTLLKNGKIVTDSIANGNILIENGKIAAITQEDLAIDGQTVDCKGKYIVPGLIDMHVHLREPGQTSKETILSGATAAIKGGVTTLCCMANTNPVIDSALLVEWVINKGKEAGQAEVLPYACVTKGMQGEELTEMGKILQAGACGFSDDGRPIMNAEVMRRALEYSRQFSSYIACHEEDLSLVNKGSIHEGAISAKIGLRGIPAEAETVMIARDIELARLTKGRAHICHISSRHSVELVKRAKEAGIAITAEVTPNHLMMTDSACEGYDTRSKVNPPLRSEADRLALIEGLRTGVIDCVASDHAPHHIDDKFKEYDLAAFGMLGVQFIVPFLLKQIQEGSLSWMDFVKVTSANPAKILQLADRGYLKVGLKADIAIIDPNVEYIFDGAVNRSKSENTLYWGKTLTGMAVNVLKDGICMP